MRSQKKKKEEEGKCKKKQSLLERPMFMNPGPAPSQIGGRNPHFSSVEVVCFGSLGFFFFCFGATVHNYHLGGVRAPQRAHSPQKNGNFSSSAKVLSSSSSRLLLSQTPGAAHTETNVVDLRG